MDESTDIIPAQSAEPSTEPHLDGRHAQTAQTAQPAQATAPVAPAEPRRRYYGGNGRTMLARVDTEIRIAGDTAVSLAVNRQRQQLLLYLGGLRIVGGAADIRVIETALAEGLSELDSQAERVAVETAQTATEERCDVCGRMHAPDEPHATSGQHADRESAYRLLRRKWLAAGEPEVIVDSVAMWLAIGDVASARVLLKHFVDASTTHDVIDLLTGSE